LQVAGLATLLILMTKIYFKDLLKVYIFYIS
jgi:hypothetical protein